MNTYTANDMAIACAKRLSGQVPLGQLWHDTIAHHGIELADDGAFTITLENGQIFRVAVTSIDQRVCVTCDQHIIAISPSRYAHADPNVGRDHTAEPKIAHPMDTDPFAGIPGADNDEDTW